MMLCLVHIRGYCGHYIDDDDGCYLCNLREDERGGPAHWGRFRLRELLEDHRCLNAVAAAHTFAS